MNKKTSDIYFASALLSLGAILVNTNKNDPRHMEFEFTEPEDTIDVGFGDDFLDTAESQWVNRTLAVNAFDFAEAIKRMKSLVHSF